MLKTFVRFKTTINLKKSPPLSVFGIDGRYVSALYSAAHEKKQLEEAEAALKAFQQELHKPKVIDFIETSIISRNDKGKLLASFGKAAGFPSTAVHFLALVAENGRLKMLRRMINKFLAIMVAHRNQALCEVITAKPLDSGTRSSLMEALKKLAKGKEITLTEKVDPSIIGGLIVGIEDKHIDMSIAKKLQVYTGLIKQSI